MKSKMKKGDKFASLTFTGQRKSQDNRWLGEFACDCGNTRFLRFDVVLRGIYKSCGCKGRSTGYTQRRIAFGEDYPFHVLISLFRKNAKKRKIPFHLSIDDVKNQFAKQSGKCAYTGVPIIPPANFLRVFDSDVASIDRIDSTKGYIPGNIQLVTKTVNIMKQSLSHDLFLATCRAVVNR